MHEDDEYTLSGYGDISLSTADFVPVQSDVDASQKERDWMTGSGSWGRGAKDGFGNEVSR